MTHTGTLNRIGLRITCLSEEWKSLWWNFKFHCKLSERLHRKRWKLGSLPRLGNRGLQESLCLGEDAIIMHFITQATSDIREKVQKLEARLPTPLSILVEAFKVYSNQNLMEEANKDKGLVKKTILAAHDSPAASSGPWRLRRLGRWQRSCLGLNQCAFCHSRRHCKRGMSLPSCGMPKGQSQLSPLGPEHLPGSRFHLIHPRYSRGVLGHPWYGR